MMIYTKISPIFSSNPVSKNYMSPLPRKVWNTEYQDDFDQNLEISL